MGRRKKNPIVGSPATGVHDSKGLKSVTCVVTGAVIERTRSQVANHDSETAVRFRVLQHAEVWGAVLEKEVANGTRSKENADFVSLEVGKLMNSTQPGEENSYSNCKKSLAAAQKTAGGKGRPTAYSRNQWKVDILERASAAVAAADLQAGAAVAAQVGDLATRMSKVGEPCLLEIC